MSDAPHAGLFVALEGIDGSGTTSQAHLLVDWLGARDESAVFTCEPSDGQIGRLLRSILRGEERYAPGAVALLFAADRIDHVEREVRPPRDRGIHVVSDRYVYSSLAYQSLAQPLDWVAGINALAPEPDLTVYVRVAAETAAARRARRGAADELYDALNLQRAIAARYDELLGSCAADGDWLEEQGRWILRGADDTRARGGAVAVLDGEAPLDDVQAKLRGLLAALLERNTR